MKKIIAILLLVAFLCSCATFSELPREQKARIVVRTVIIVGAAVAATIFIIVDEDALSVGFPK
jgi:hypothetical protein